MLSTLCSLEQKKEGILSIASHNLRLFCEEGQRVDGRLVGGGAGMLLRYPPCKKAIKSLKREESAVLMMAPSGKKLTPALLQKYSEKKHLILLAGHYEGFDARVEGEVDEVISVCDLVLTQGVLASMVFIDAMARYIPGVIGKQQSLEEESYSVGVRGAVVGSNDVKPAFCPLLEAPHYSDEKSTCSTSPQVPHQEILQSGHHKNIEALRFLQSLKRTEKNRPDLYRDLLNTIHENLFEKEKKQACTRLFLPVFSLAQYRKTLVSQLRLPTWEEKGKILALRVDSTLLVLYEDPVTPSTDPVSQFEAHLPISSGLLRTMQSLYIQKKKDWDRTGNWQFNEQGVLFSEKRGRFALFFEGNFFRV